MTRLAAVPTPPSLPCPPPRPGAHGVLARLAAGHPSRSPLRAAGVCAVVYDVAAHRGRRAAAHRRRAGVVCVDREAGAGCRAVAETMTVLDLFSGIGGFSLAFERHGFHTIAFSEVDPFCCRVLAHHWPAVPNLGDVRCVDGRAIVEQCGAVDVVVGGFPCQDISSAGKGAGLSGDRSGLWWEMHRLVRKVRPRWLCIENVPALRTRGADDVLGALESAGYACWPTVVGAWAVGAPHKRDRVWIVGKLAHAHDERRDGIDALLQPGRSQQDRVEAAGRGAGRWPSRPGEPQHEWEAPRLTQPGVGAATDGLPTGLVRRAGRRRRDQLKAVGNSIVPQVAELFAAFIAEQMRRAA